MQENRWIRKLNRLGGSWLGHLPYEEWCRYAGAGRALISHPLGAAFVRCSTPRDPYPPAKFGSFTSLQIVHTHAPQWRGFLRLRPMRSRWKWKGNWNETTMKMRWQLLNRDTRRGTQKRKGRGKTPGKPRKCKGKEKADGRRAKHRPEEGGRTEAPDTTYKVRAKPTSAREGPKPDLERESTHEIGTSWWKLMHPQSSATAVIRLKALGGRFNPINRQ